MNVLVDTCIWSLALRRLTPQEVPQIHLLKELISEQRVVMIGAIRQEILSGIREQSQFDLLRDKMRSFPDFPLLQEDYETPSKKVGEREVTTVKELKSITSVIKDFDFFASEKWKIASDKQGSGNTANIGSIVDIADLKSGNGIFSLLGEEWFDEYWINHGSATMLKDGRAIKITTLKDFLEFKGRIDLWDKIVAKTSKKKIK